MSTEQECWAAYAAEQERHAETKAQLARCAAEAGAAALRAAADALQADMDGRTGSRVLVASIPQWLRGRASSLFVSETLGCCGHTHYDHSASNVSGCYYCECDIDA